MDTRKKQRVEELRELIGNLSSRAQFHLSRIKGPYAGPNAAHARAVRGLLEDTEDAVKQLKEIERS